MTAKLPSQFTELEPFLDWALPTERERYAKRLASTMDDIQAFYDAIFPRGKEALDHLDTFPLDAMPEPELNLLRLVLSWMIISIPVEAFRQPRIPDTGASDIICLAEPTP